MFVSVLLWVCSINLPLWLIWVISGGAEKSSASSLLLLFFPRWVWLFLCKSVVFLVSSSSLIDSEYLDLCFGVCSSSLFWLSSFVFCEVRFFVFSGYVVVFVVIPSILLFSGASGELVNDDRRSCTVCGSLLMFFPFFGVF